MNQNISSYCFLAFLLFSTVILGNGYSIGNTVRELKSCSAFHFEEMVLEKLVRIEHNIQMNEVKMKNWGKKMQTKLKSIDGEFEEKVKQWEEKLNAKFKLISEKNMEKENQLDTAIQTKFRSIDAEIENRTNGIQLLQDQLILGISYQESVFKEMEKNLTDLSISLSEDQRDAMENMEKKGDELLNQQAQTNATLFHQLQNVGYETKVPLVLFRAHYVSPDTDLKKTVIKFTQVSTNIGNGYDKNSGYFTVPITGVYIFALKICSEMEKHVHMKILAKRKEIANLYSYQNVRNGPCVSSTGFASLSKKDRVFIYCHSADSGDSVYTGYHDGNYFTGVLIHK